LFSLVRSVRSPRPALAPPAASRATAYVPTRCRSRSSRVLHARRVERRAPASVVVLRQLEVEALAVRPRGDVADAGPGVEPGAERPEGVVAGRGRGPAKPRAARGSWPRWSTRYCSENPRRVTMSVRLRVRE